MIAKPPQTRYRVGDLRPSQLLYTYGVGAMVDLPNISTLVMGLDDWDIAHSAEIGEERLLAAVRAQLGGQLQKLLSPPAEKESGGPKPPSPFDAAALVGVPVAPFPRWMICPLAGCRLLAPVSSGLFALKPDPYRPDRTRYVHTNCSQGKQPPGVIPARFLIACPHGHLDDFPWDWFVHRGLEGCKSILRLREFGPSGEAADVEVQCDTCKQKRRMSDAFGAEGRKNLPLCTGRRPHLRDYDPEPCEEPDGRRTILLGASNSWFPLTLSALALPAQSDPLGQLVAEHWVVLDKAPTIEVLSAFRSIGQLPTFSAYSDADVWAAIQKHRATPPATADDDAADLKAPEWAVFSEPEAAPKTSDFRLTPVAAPDGYAALFRSIVLVERLREVRALIGFTRIASPGDFDEMDATIMEKRSPLARKPPLWVPTVEVRGEGIFIQFDEGALAAWEATPALGPWRTTFFAAHRDWRTMRHLLPVEGGWPGMRYVLLHSFAHALMRVLAIECGYPAASIRERIYARGPKEKGGPMAGVLISTAAPDSEGTLGGLVKLGQPENLGRLLAQALEAARLCASDPLCAEHQPAHEAGVTLHGAACHVCLFAPETSCERGNKYLDRSLLVDPLIARGRAFFPKND